MDGSYRKIGKYHGFSTYEKDFLWPEMAAKLERLPLLSTIGMGILPILGTKEDAKTDDSSKEVSTSTGKMKDKLDDEKKPKPLER